MVVLLDLDVDSVNDPYHTGSFDAIRHTVTQCNDAQHGDEVHDKIERVNPNLNSFSAALSCYPIISQIACSLDQNSLHELSRSCRQIRADLLQYRLQLIAHTLRCDNEDASLGPRPVDRLREAHEDWNTFGPNGVRVSKITSGRVGSCARDMVGECRRCARVICRNCIVKIPAPVALKGRNRRICRTCNKSPLEKHTSISFHRDGCGEGLGFVRDTAVRSLLSSIGSLEPSACKVFARDPCDCAENVWICQPCGQSLRTTDVTYMRGWNWRTRYSASLGGLGTGIGEGIEGVQCGKQSQCLAAKEVEKEIDCDAEEMAFIRRQIERAQLEGRATTATSYLMQEIEGIGGVVKKKVKQRVRVGAAVKEYEDEREHGSYLSREQDGTNRSWCSWCQRVIQAKKDLAIPGKDALGRTILDSDSSSSSSV